MTPPKRGQPLYKGQNSRSQSVPCSEVPLYTFIKVGKHKIVGYYNKHVFSVIVCGSAFYVSLGGGLRFFLFFLSNSYDAIQWNLRTRDTLGLIVCPLSRGCPYLGGKIIH